MRYKVDIAPGKNASAVANAVSCNHGSWSDTVDGVGGISGVAFIETNDGEDDDLIRELEDHKDVVGYSVVEFVSPPVSDETSYTLTLTTSDGGDTSGKCDPDCDYSYIRGQAEEWCRTGDWHGEDGTGCEVTIRWKITDDSDGEVEYDGEVIVQIPGNEWTQVKVAGGDPDCDHEWERDDRVGCAENPGVVGLGGTAVSVTDICGGCGIVRNTRHNGCQRNPGQPEIQVSYEGA